jgi:hypothetical protein
MSTAMQPSSPLLEEKATLPGKKTKPAPIPLEKIRTDLNLEKWSLWQPAHSVNKKSRTLTRITTDKDGVQKQQKVTVIYADPIGTLTTEDQKTFYALVKHWENSGRLETTTFFSLRHLSRILNKKWGTYTKDTLSQSLTRLRAVGIIWTDSYFDPAKKDFKKILEAETPFTILSNLKVIRTKVDGHITKEHGYFRFDDDILGSLRANFTKPLLLEVVLKFNNEIAQILYTHLDLILADKTMYERRTKELFQDLALQGTAYRNPSKRKQMLERAIKELVNVPLTTGRISSATIEKTKDKEDYKIVIRKGSLAALPRVNHYQDSPAVVAEGGEVMSEAQQPSALHISIQTSTEAEELVKHFHQIFYNNSSPRLTTKAIDQAVTLIANHGIKKAEYIVDYAHREAPKTNFDIQTFGGVMHYEHRALADFERRQIQQEEAQKAREAAQAKIREELEEEILQQAAKEKAKARLAQLPPEQYQALYDECAKQFKTSEFFKSHYTTETVQNAIKSLMLKRIEPKQGMNADGETACETNYTSSNEPVDTGTDQPIG